MILILKMEENMQHFWHIMLYYFKKDRNATEMQKKKKICAAMEKVLWLIKCVKNDLWSCMLDISPWRMPHGQAGQLKLRAIKSRH